MAMAVNMMTSVNPFVIDINTAGFPAAKRPKPMDDTPAAVQEVLQYLEDEPYLANKEAPHDWPCTAEEERACKDTYVWLSKMQEEIKTAGVPAFFIWEALRVDKHVLNEWITRYRNGDRGIKFRKAMRHLRVMINKWRHNGRKMRPLTLDEWVMEQDEKNTVPGYVKQTTKEGDIIFVRAADNKKLMYAPMEPHSPVGAGGAPKT